MSIMYLNETAWCGRDDYTVAGYSKGGNAKEGKFLCKVCH